MGKVSECTGECYSTYTLVSTREDLLRVKVKLVEIFFLDEEYNPRIKPDDLEGKCEFRTIPAREPDQMIVFARERRVVQEDIEKLMEEVAAMPWMDPDDLERLHSALNRFETNLRVPDYPKEKLLNEITVVGKIVDSIRNRIVDEIKKNLEETT